MNFPTGGGLSINGCLNDDLWHVAARSRVSSDYVTRYDDGRAGAARIQSRVDAVLLDLNRDNVMGMGAKAKVG